MIRNHTSLDLAASYFEYLVPAGPFSVSLSQQPGDQRLQAVGADHSSLDMGGSDTISDTTVQISATVDSSGAVATAIGLNASTLQLRPGDHTIILRGTYWGDRALVFGGAGNDTITGYGIGRDSFIQAGDGNDVVSLGRIETTSGAAPVESGWLFQGARFSGFEQVLFG